MDSDEKIYVNDDDYALISCVCAYSVQTEKTYMGYIYKAKSPNRDDRLYPPYYYVLIFRHTEITISIDLDNLNELIRTFEARVRCRGFIPLIDRSLYVANVLEV
jgi:hypothetical protein